MKYRPYGIHKIYVEGPKGQLQSDRQPTAEHPRNWPHKGDKLEMKGTTVVSYMSLQSKVTGQMPAMTCVNIPVSSFMRSAPRGLGAGRQ